MLNFMKNFQMNDPFFSRYETLIKEAVIPYQEKALNDEIPGAEKSHAIANFKIAAKYLQSGEQPEDFYGMVFQDSDIAKWLEAVSYSLILFPDKELEARADALIDLIGSAQQADGYLNTYFTLHDDKKHFSNLHEAHELYCAGHMMEAAVAYFESTGKRKLLDIMLKMTDCIYQHFIVEKAPGYPGHPEVELALMRMYDVTGSKKCLTLAAHFINVRGVDPDYFEKERKTTGWMIWGGDPSDHDYAQNAAPLREQSDAVGHAVRAVYLYTGMAALAKETGDTKLKNACIRLWESITKKRSYITGGIGSTYLGEAFTTDYDLPNDTAYAETCASIGLIFFARKMLDLECDSTYSDMMERTLYNGVLSGMQLNGQRFFYVNHLESIPGISGTIATHKHTLPERPQWFGCACCPPNIARLLPSISEYAWGETASTVFSHLYLSGDLTLERKQVTIRTQSAYPYDDVVHYSFIPKQESAKFTFAIRIPDWSRHTQVLLNNNVIYEKTNTSESILPQNSADVSAASDKPDDFQTTCKNGYLYITRSFSKEDVLTLKLDMTP
ncbi:MAG TPA: glycoside hydrolase family 127 protein, partial [Lachnospiraceae bacterium]|nr:glycoside hydrolase family 127 protein [Lachnospiraceae bacterium]